MKKKTCIICLSLMVLLVYGYSNAIADPMLLSLNKPVTGSDYYYYDGVWGGSGGPGKEIFSYENVNDGKLNDSPTGNADPRAWSYWLTPNGTTGWFEINLQNVYSISYFDIQNTKNRTPGNDRSGKDFTISLSNDRVNYTPMLSRTLKNAIDLDYPLPIERFNLTSPQMAQYVKFNLNSYYGEVGGGINELSVYGSPVPLPPSVWLFGSGLVGLIGLRRFRRS